MTLNEIAYSIWNKLRPQISDDDNLDIREIKDEIHKQRALLIRNELNKSRTVDPFLIQDLGCIPLEQANAVDCCEIDVSDCTILRTAVEIPSPIELHNKTLLTRVGPTDRINISYNLVNYHRIPFVGNGRFNKTLIYAFLLNNRLYLYSKSDKVKYLEYINIQGVFENPSDLEAFTNCNDETCYSDDDEYPIKAWMLPYLEDYVLKKFIPTIQMPIDLTNDGEGKVESSIQK